MKSKLILMAVAAGALSFTACNKKIDEKTMAEIKQFDTDWTATGTSATAWSTEMTAEKQKATDHVTKQTAMMTGMMDKIKDDATKTKLTELDKTDHEAVAAMEGMATNYAEFNTTWTANTTAWNEWKTKAEKGEISNEEATKAMTDWNAKLTDAKAKVQGWQTAYNTIKDNCEKNMAECDHMTTSMTTAEATTTTKTSSTKTTGNANGTTTKTTKTTKTKTTTK